MSTDGDKARSKSPCNINIGSLTVPSELLNSFIKKRGTIKGRLTRFLNYLDSIETSKSVLSERVRIDLKLRVRGVTSLYAEFNSLQTKIEEIIPESELENQLTQRDLFEDCYYSALTKAEFMIGTETADSSKCRDVVQQSVKLPTISIPVFGGDYEHWLEFRDTFLSLVHNSKEISNIQKFHYLKSSLKGSAALVIDSLEFSASNYAVAWELLINRYNNSNLLIHNHVKAIFSIQTLTKESPTVLRRLIDTILKNLRALKLLGEPTESWDTLIIYIVVSKLDNTTEREWEQYKCTNFNFNHGDSKVNIDNLLQFLKRRADMLETLSVSHSKVNNYVFNKKQTHESVKVHCNVSNNKLQHSSQHRIHSVSCVMCNGKHQLYSCQRFLDLNLDAKLKLIDKHNLCHNCLRPGHTVSDCRFGPCRKCNKKHNSLIHNDELTSSPSTALLTSSSANTNQPGGPSASRGTQLIATSMPLTPHCADTAKIYKNIDCIQLNEAHTVAHDICMPVLLSTALVEVADKYNSYHTVRALLDCGSQRCFITKSLCELLDIAFIQSTHEIRGVGNSVSQSTQICDIEIKSRINNYSTRITCFVLPQITTTLPAVNIQSAQFSIPENIQLANPYYFESQEIDILIGADRFWDLLLEGKIRLPKGPFLQNTLLGWIVSGSVYANKISNSVSVHCNLTQSVDTQLRRFWELEELPRVQNTLSDDELECEKSFVKNTTRETNGRFCVRIPLKESADTLGKTFSQAQRQFLALEKRLDRAPEYKKLYSEFIREYIDLGHMTPVNSFGKPHFIMPHHGVFRAHSTTTKLRVVFNASASSSSGKSLNDIQLVGPAIQGDLFAILLRFRQYKYIACADIEKMYRQILVCPEQRDLQMIIWRDDSSQPLGLYRLNTVTYGTASAAFLSCRCLKQLAADCDDCDVKRVINDSFYVDDMVAGHDDRDKLLEICAKTAKTLMEGCFPLRKWIFNFSHNGQSLEPLPCASKELALGENIQSKTLGIGWYNYSDEFHFTSSFENKPTPLTKRQILSTVSQIFDPLGILAPTVILAKILLQKLWLSKLDWDDPVPGSVALAWERFVSDLSALSSIRVPRYVVGENPTSIELHVFTDASLLAYGTCIYIRTISTSQATVRLLCSKSKVAPLKPVSIPRLELCGALLGARLYDKVRESLQRHFDQVVFWTDSTIVLGWLRMAPNLLKTFVQNRTTEIHELTKEHPWRHVSGKDNPADLVSRGVGLTDLSKMSLWWHGPSFLCEPKFSYDTTSSPCPIETDTQDLPEVRPRSVHSLVADQKVSTSLFPFHRFSQFNRMTRAAGYILRFVHNARNKQNKKTGALDVDELRDAVDTLARLSQLDSFRDEYESLLKNGKLKIKHNLSKLALFIGDDKLIRVGGRIEYSSHFDYNKKHPVLISSKHHFSVLLFRYEHKQLLHAAQQALLSTLRERWWPVRGRDLARKVIHECVTCKRFMGKHVAPLMGSLPAERITPTYPFIRCGVDYAGPMLVLNRKGRGARTIKAYICLFVCFVTRAIHLELVSSLSSDAYLLALKRFISRRGKPEVIFSDNGRNFVGLMNEFKKFLENCSSDILEYATSQQIKFKFIPPYSAHHGGLWERGVQSCKYHIHRVVGNAHLTFEELTTLLTQVEAVLNSRPLSPLSSDPNDLAPLTPAHFLVGRTLTAPATADVQDTPVHRLTRYQRMEQLRQHFWSRWSKEYISEMQSRIKWRENVDNLTPNTLVVVKDDNLPPLKWQMGRIEQIMPGKDGIVRVVDIRTASGVIRRAVTKICPLLCDK